MQKHTPGPWAIKGPSRGDTTMDDGGDYAIVADGQIIAEAICKTAASTFQPTEANAQLIAAAPDLLAALEQTVAAFEHWFPRWADPEGTRSPMMQQAHAALAKACSPS